MNSYTHTHTRFILVFILLLKTLIGIAQPTVYETDPGRGLYVNQFVKLTPSGDLYHDGSILGVDADSDGIFEKEVELFEFAMDNHFTHLILYDLRRIFGQTAPLVWNQRALQYQTLEQHLCRFMSDAQAYCVKTFGASGGYGTLRDAGKFDGDPSTLSPTPPMVLTQDEWNLIPRLRIV